MSRKCISSIRNPLMLLKSDAAFFYFTCGGYATTLEEIHHCHIEGESPKDRPKIDVVLTLQVIKHQKQIQVSTISCTPKTLFHLAYS